MKREGRQHGMVQTHPIIESPLNPRRITNLESPATAGLFAKVCQKPTNHSKFTGKCGRPRCATCHMHPAGKAKDKTKGTQKLKSCDVLTNYRLVTWRVVDVRPGLNFNGFSATGILDHLADDLTDEDGYDIDDTPDASADEAYDYEGSVPHSNAFYHHIPEFAIASTSGVAIEELDEVDDGPDCNRGGDDDTSMSFCEVGFVWEQVEGDSDGWCLVVEI